MKTISWILLGLCLTFFSCKQSQNNIYNVKNFGAVGDSLTLNTKSFQRAINTAEKAGGGTVLVPPGVYISGTIFMKDNITLEVMAGAKIFGSPNIEDYTEMVWGHNKDRQPYHLIVGHGVQNIEIRGGGIIDGNGEAFWQDWHPDSLPEWIMAKDLKVSPMMEIWECKNVIIKDVTLLTGGGWTLHLYDSDHVQVRGVKILNNVYAPNGDGIDITGCYDVTISDCIIKTCDDAICVKTTVDSRDAKRITVTNNVIECLCAALKIGNETFRDISQITFSNNVIFGSSRGFAIYAESAGTVSDIIVSNTILDTRVSLLYNRPIHLSLYLPEPGAGGRNGDWMFKEGEQWDYEGREPRLRNIIIDNFITRTQGRILITAEDGRYIENLTLRDVHMDYVWVEDPTIYVDDVKSSQFAPVKHEAKIATAAMVLENVENLTVDNFRITWPESDTVPEDWRFEKVIANGTLEPFYPEYGPSVPVPFNAIYGRGLKGGYIDAPLSSSSSSAIPKYNIANSYIRIRN